MAHTFRGARGLGVAIITYLLILVLDQSCSEALRLRPSMVRARPAMVSEDTTCSSSSLLTLPRCTMESPPGSDVAPTTMTTTWRNVWNNLRSGVDVLDPDTPTDQSKKRHVDSATALVYH